MSETDKATLDGGVVSGDGNFVLYAENSSDTENSLAHRTGSEVHDVFQVGFYDSNRQTASQGLWRCYTTTPAEPIGQVTNVAGVGIVLNGTDARYVLMPGPNNVVDIRACGILCDGDAHSQHSLFERICDAARDMNLFLTNRGRAQDNISDRGGHFRIAETVDVTRINCDLSFQAGDQQDVVGGVRFYTGSEPNITTEVVDGVTVGVAVLAGGNGSNREQCIQRIWVQGDGIFDEQDTSTCVGVLFGGDDSVMADYTAYTAYCFAGVVISGSEEKHRIETHHLFNNHCVYMKAASSADTLQLEIYAQSCLHLYFEPDGLDASMQVFFNAEARNDPGDGTPAIYIRNGKTTTLKGYLRALDGDVQILVDRASTLVDSLFIDNLRVIDVDGCVLKVHQCRRLSGHISIRDCKPATSTTPGPTMWLNRVWNAGNFTADIVQCSAREAIRIGDDANDMFPTDTSFGPFSVDMGNTNPETPAFPTGSQALVIEKMVGGKLEMSQIKGMTTIDATVEAGDHGLHISLPGTARRYTLTDNSGGAATVQYQDEAAAGSDQVGISAFIEEPVDKSYVLVYRAPYAMTIDEIDVKTASGTCTLALKINSTAVTDISAVSVTSSNSNAVASAANDVVVDDLIQITISSASSPVDLQLTVKATKA